MDIVTNKVTTFHGKGLAFDICQNISGKAYEVEFFSKVADLAKPMGFEGRGVDKLCRQTPFSVGKRTYVEKHTCRGAARRNGVPYDKR